MQRQKQTFSLKTSLSKNLAKTVATFTCQTKAKFGKNFYVILEIASKQKLVGIYAYYFFCVYTTGKCLFVPLQQFH